MTNLTATTRDGTELKVGDRVSSGSPTVWTISEIRAGNRVFVADFNWNYTGGNGVFRGTRLRKVA